MSILCAAMNLYSWGLAVVVIIFVYLIGRFFEEKAGQRSHYQAFLVPMVLFLLAALRYVAYAQDFVGDLVGDALLFGGGLALMLSCRHLLALMVGGKK
ncbi:MAG: hypothetical protein BWY77_01753 [bacterium ADurb.Bin431]|nr:hypothetical protein [Chloroflexota bacterium]OPZ77148.1 MAG: hypothetical protein BWY77_01753 [bacterium ADurb.Bin431]